MTTEALHILAGWIGVSLGVLTGAVFGLAFHKENWLGGYNSWTRRMLRLGHISFFGIAFLNFMFAITTDLQALHGTLIQIGSILFLVGAATMPTACFLSAWKKPLKNLFPVPVASICGALVCVITSILQSLKNS
jgi:hypothetical protein